MRLAQIYWIKPHELVVLKDHAVETLEQLASLELVDSVTNVPPLDNLRALARRARASLGRDHSLEQIDAPVGGRGPVQRIGHYRR